MKTCTRCKQEKQQSEFHKGKGKDGLNHWCKKCAIEYRIQHYKKNRSHHMDNAKKIVQRNKDFVRKYLLEHPCQDCGETDPIVLDFDHLRDKKKNVSNMIWQGNSLENISNEIAKCEVVCSNCHRRRTYGRLAQK